MAVTTNYLVTGNGITGSTANAVQALVSVAGIGREKRGASALRAGRPWLRLPTAATQVGSGGAISHGGSATGAFTTKNGRPCYEITSPANASLQSMFFSIASGTVTNRQHIVFEVEDAEQWRGGSWRLGFYTDGTFVNGTRANMTADSYNGYNGVHCIAPLAGEWSNVGAGSFSSTMTQCIFQFQRKTGASGNTRIWVYEIAEAEKSSLPQIVIGADEHDEAPAVTKTTAGPVGGSSEVEAVAVVRRPRRRAARRATGAPQAEG